VRPDYVYYALCHNCQKWHLPIPCKEELSKCGGCSQLGHVQEYCPLNPIPSQSFTGNVASFISHDLTPDNTQWIMHNAALADEIYKIKMGAVMDTLQLSTGTNREEVRAYLAHVYRGRAPPLDNTSYHPASTQSSMSRQLPTPTATVRTEINTGLPLPLSNITHAQAHDQSYEDYNTLAPLQLRDSDGKSRQTAQVDTRGSTMTSATNHESNAAPDVQKTPEEPRFSLGFRTYDDNGDCVQVEVDGDSSGNGISTQGSSPCDDRANSVESKDETEQEREFYEGGLY
jgi:hypothetical protein